MSLKNLVETCGNEWKFLKIWFDDVDESKFNVSMPDWMYTNSQVRDISDDAGEHEIVVKWFMKRESDGNLNLYVLLHAE